MRVVAPRGSMVVRVLVVVLLSIACTPLERPSDLGPAVFSLYLGNETDIAGLLTLRGGTSVVFATEVSTEGFGRRDGLRGASVGVATDGPMVDAAPLGRGAYLTDVGDARELAPSDTVSVEVDHAGRELALEGPIPPILRLPLATATVRAGQDALIPLPQRWWTTYPLAVSTLFATDGRVVWTDRPDDLEAWLERLSDPPRPRTLVLPAAVLSPGDLVLAVAFVEQMDEYVAFDGPINEPFSGLWAGTAWLLPLSVRR